MFRTFSHISQYGLNGYRDLGYLIACSSPLVIWAPSKNQLKELAQQAGTRGFRGTVTPEALLDYVRAGSVRIAARKSWFDQKEREKRHTALNGSWNGYEWYEDFDGKLRGIAQAEDDVAKPKLARSVLIIQDEDGAAFAEKAINAGGDELIERVYASYKTDRLPIGVRQQVDAANPRNPMDASKEIIRHCRNHLRAINDARCEAPFLSTSDGEHYRFLLDITQAVQPETPTVLVSPLSRAKVLREAVAILARFSTSRTNLEKFIGSDDQIALAGWLKSELKLWNDAPYGHLASRLLEELKPTASKRKVKGRFGELKKAGAQTADVFSGLAQVALGNLSPVFFAKQLVKPAKWYFRELKGEPHPDLEFNIPTWPFMYAFRREPNWQEWSKIKKWLQRLIAHAKQLA